MRSFSSIEIDGPGGELGLEAEPLDRHRAAVDPPEQALALQLAEVPADRLGGHAELVGRGRTPPGPRSAPAPRGGAGARLRTWMSPSARRRRAPEAPAGWFQQPVPPGSGFCLCWFYVCLCPMSTVQARLPWAARPWQPVAGGRGVFKRVFWMGTGVAVGAGSAFWAKRRIEQAVQQLMPDQVADRAATSARDLGRNVRDAAAEGRAAMREREAELRAQVEATHVRRPRPDAAVRRRDGPSLVAGPVGRRPRPSWSSASPSPSTSSSATTRGTAASDADRGRRGASTRPTCSPSSPSRRRSGSPRGSCGAAAGADVADAALPCVRPRRPPASAPTDHR